MSSAAFHLAAITSVFWQKYDSHAFYDSATPMIFHLTFKMQVRSSFGQSIKDDNIFYTDGGGKKRNMTDVGQSQMGILSKSRSLLQ